VSLRRIVPEWAVATLVATFLLTVAAASQLVDFRTGRPLLRIDASADRLLPEGDETRAFYDRVRRLFGSDELLLVALVTDDVFNAETLLHIASLTRAIEAVEGVHHVLSLTNAVNVRGVGDDLEIAPFVGREIPRLPDELAELRREVMSNPIYAGNLVSRDARYGADRDPPRDVEPGIPGVRNRSAHHTTGRGATRPRRSLGHRRFARKRPEY